jgi:multiple sugar transport system permease protein
LGVDVAELRIPVGVAVALRGLAVALQTVTHLIEQVGDQGATDRVTLRLQRLRQVAHALAGPSQRRFRITACRRLDQCLENFWHQFGNSLFIGLVTVLLTVLIGSLASFAVTRMRLSKGSLLTNAALLTYAIPASFLIVPYFRIMHSYGLSDNPWAVIAAQVTFATPFAILILQLYARLIPFELDDAARVDGASAVQVYLRIYLPLMTPALAVVAIYALLLAWNDYLYPSVLLAVRNMTVAVTQGQLFADVDAPWNAMMAAAIIYVLPPIALLFVLRRHLAAGLTMADVTG